jgi:hypothetical protein
LKFDAHLLHALRFVEVHAAPVETGLQAAEHAVAAFSRDIAAEAAGDASLGATLDGGSAAETTMPCVMSERETCGVWCARREQVKHESEHAEYSQSPTQSSAGWPLLSARTLS